MSAKRVKLSDTGFNLKEVDPILEETDLINTLPDEVIQYLFRFLPGFDLLRCTEVRERFRDVITSHKSAMKKIKLRVNCKSIVDGDLQEILRLAEKRSFVNVELEKISALRSNEHKAVFRILTERLSHTVENLTIRGQVLQLTFVTLLDLFLPTLKSITLKFISFVSFEHITQWVPAVNLTLTSLGLIGTEPDLALYFFNGCQRLKKFRYQEQGDGTTRIGNTQLNIFLAPLHDLVHLSFIGFGLEFNRLTCYHLKRFRSHCNSTEENEISAANFIRGQRNLKSLDLEVSRSPSRQLMTVICDSHNLRSLTMRFRNYPWGNRVFESLEGLRNTTVQHLMIFDEACSTRHILQVFKGASEIMLRITGTELIINEVSQETLHKITFHPDQGNELIHIVLGSRDMTADMEEVQSSTLTFLRRNEDYIKSVTIGYPGWRQDGLHKVSNAFCYEVMELDVEELKVYNIEDQVAFLQYASTNTSSTIKRFKLVQPLVTSTGEPMRAPHFEIY